MVELRHLSINNNNYYYLFCVIENNNVFKKYKKYIGKVKPSEADLKILKSDFIHEIKNNTIKETNNVIELLQKAQSNDKYISEEELVEISKNQDIPLTELIGVATFYSEFKLKKQGKYQIKICNGTACHVKHSTELINWLQDFLKIKPGELTKDNKFSLEVVNCIGACARAPAMMINENIYGELTKDKINNILKSLK